MEMTTIEIDVPKEILPLIEMESEEMKLKRKALLLHLYINNETISHGKVAEFLGINKLDLITIYSELGLSYFDSSMEQIEEDAQMIKELRGVF